ncbi:MAG: exostosin family protein [Chthoniobacterales bacterium]
MATVFLLSAAPPKEQTAFNMAALAALQRSAAQDRFGVHRLVDDPSAADMIIFAELNGAGLHFQAIRRHPLVKRYREKCFIFSSNAYVIPFLPGVYASIERRWFSRRTLSGFHVSELLNEFTAFTPPSADLPYLFSFIGSIATAPVRRDLARVKHPRGLFRDTAEEFARVSTAKMTVSEARAYHRQYVEITKATKFVLCPRGLGVATLRLFETMRMGRVPVIIADNWVEPPGPEWSRFSIRIAEREVDRIPQILETREQDAVAMGALAREEWERWFSDEVAFHRVVESCLQLRKQRRFPEALERWPVYLQLLRPVHLRFALRKPYRVARQRLLRRTRDTAKAMPHLA